MKRHEESSRWFNDNKMDSKYCPVCGSRDSYALFDPGESEPQRDSREFIYCRVCGLVLSFLGAITSRNLK